MTDYRSLYDKDFIGAWDLQDGDMTVTITKVIGGNLTGIGGRKSKKPVVYMSHTDKGFACNVTNGRTIATMYGVHVEKWVSKKITLYKSTTRNPDGTGDVECIRVRPSVRTEDQRAAGGTASPGGPDAGSTLPDVAAGGPATVDFLTADDVVQLEQALQDAGVSIEAFKKRAKIERLAQLPLARYAGAMEWVRSMSRKQQIS